MRGSSFMALSVLFLISCSGDREKKSVPESGKSTQKMISVPEFNADSAYFFVNQQVDFGPRIPNSPAHRKAGNYFVDKLTEYGAVVTTQNFVVTTYDNQKLSLRNIIATFHPQEKKRILLAAHWDTRPYADKDPEKPQAKFDGANDGASGVGVLLEFARVMNHHPAPNVGIDIILFDGEDWGEKAGQQNNIPVPTGLAEWWCLGSQHWSKNKHKQNYTASFGILVDMVGGKNAQFAREGYSVEYAPGVVDKIWQTASHLGYSHFFVNLNEGFIVDDHRFVNEIAKIPMVNIVSYDPVSGFGDFHHTRKDNMEIISKETLQAVGQTLLYVIYYE